MDRKNDGDLLAPPRPPKSIPGIHRPRIPEPPMSALVTPVRPCLSNQQREQQLQQLRTNNSHHHSHLQQNYQSNNNIVLQSSRPSDDTCSLISSNNINNNNNSNHNGDSLSVHPVPITAPLIPLHQQHVALNVSNSNLSSTIPTSTNSFIRRRVLPPLSISGQHSSNNNSNSNISNTLLPSISSNIQSVESPASPVTLAAPRPENERLANEYVDTPLRTHHSHQNLLQQASRLQHPAGQTHGQTTTNHSLLLLQQNERRQQQQHHHSHSSHNHRSNNAISGTSISLSNSRVGWSNGGATLLHSNISGSHKDSCTATMPISTTQATAPTSAFLFPGQTARQQQHHRQQQHVAHSRPTALPIPAIIKQPTSFSKDLPASILHDEVDSHHSGPNGSESPSSIMCPRCSRCRCEQCQSPRKLPSRWVCNKTCFCSAEAAIDYASCLCCAKALFFHCTKDHDMEGDDGDVISCVDDPCSCLPHRRVARWGWLTALTVALPCLLCYWPMRGCITICAQCYERHSRCGCRCQSIRSTGILSPVTSAGNVISTIKSVDGTHGDGSDHHLSSVNSTHHHHSSSIVDGRTIMSSNDLTPEKRLLDSSLEF